MCCAVVLGKASQDFARHVFRASKAKGDLMKQVVALVRPYLVEKVLEALRRAPLEAVTVSPAKGFGRQKSYLDEYTESEYSGSFLPKAEITLWVDDDTRVDDIIRKIVEAARTGRIGDGKIFVIPGSVVEF